MLSIKQAIKNIKSDARKNFDESVELHINLKLDVSKADEQVRTSLVLPHGSGKKIKVATFCDEDIKDVDLKLTESDLDKIKKGTIKPKADFDILIVEPKYMPKLAKLGAILGPAGVMPNPKTGTVTEKVGKAVEEFKKGKVEIRNEQNAPIIHTLIGKASFSEDQLVENFNAIWSALKSNKPAKAKPDWIVSGFVASSMGKSQQLDINNLDS